MTLISVQHPTEGERGVPAVSRRRWSEPRRALEADPEHASFPDSSTSSGSGVPRCSATAAPAACTSQSIVMPAASITRWAAPVTSGPIPSPGMSVIVYGMIGRQPSRVAASQDRRRSQRGLAGLHRQRAGRRLALPRLAGVAGRPVVRGSRMRPTRSASCGFDDAPAHGPARPDRRSSSVPKLGRRIGSQSQPARRATFPAGRGRRRVRLQQRSAAT